MEPAPETQAVVLAEKPASLLEEAPATVMAQAQEAARALHALIARKPKPVIINGKRYLEFEDWQTVGRWYGITAAEEGTDPVEIGEVHGFKASSVAYWRGQVISRATAYCMRDEKEWTKKPAFQLASMAQTRANAKVLRNVLSWVVVLAKLPTTPAEEMHVDADEDLPVGVPEAAEPDDYPPARRQPADSTPPPLCPTCAKVDRVMMSKFQPGRWYCNRCKKGY